MSRIFLSHSSADNFAAKALADWLGEEGWSDVFLDILPERGIVAGQRWERALHQAADRCEAVVFLVTRAWLASGWCRKEYELARSLAKQLFAVIAERDLTLAVLPPELKDTWQVTDLAGGADHRVFRASIPGSGEERHVSYSRAGLDRLKAGLKKAGLDAREFPWPPEGARNPAPYVGLRPLGGDEAGLLFGRDADLVRALDRLRALAEAAAPRVAVILGASGAGKSSFLRAGLLPRLARDDARFLALPAIRPGRAALEGESSFLAALEAVSPGRALADIRADVAEGRLGALIASASAAAGAKTLTGKPPVAVIAVDQAEELFAAEGDGKLLALLAELVHAEAPAVLLLFAIRSDAYDALEQAKVLEGIAKVALPLPPMPRNAARAVIEGPAARYAQSVGKLDLDPRLTQTLLDDLDRGGGRDALPLLAFTLEHLWREYGRSGALTLAGYEAFGGLAGAIEAGVKRAYARADQDPRIPRDEAVRDALLRRGLVPWLAGVDPDTKAPRRNVARAADIPEEARPLIDLMVEERLLSRGVDEARVTTIEPAHEALLRQWGKLKGWLDEDFAHLAALEAVQRASRDWDANARAEAWLAHRGQRLAEVAALDARPDLAAKLGAQDRAYLGACRAHEEAAQAEAERVQAERQAAQTRALADAHALAAAQTQTAAEAKKRAAAESRARRRTQIGAGAALALALAASGAATYAVKQKWTAEQSFESAKRAIRGLDDFIWKANQGAQNKAGFTAGQVGASLTEIQTILKGLIDAAPNDVDLMAVGANNYANLVDCYRTLHSPEQARSAAEKGVMIAGRMREVAPTDAQARRAEIMAAYKRADVRSDAIDRSGAIADARRAEHLAEQFAAGPNSDAASRRLQWVATEKLAEALLATKDPEAAPTFARATSLAQSLASSSDAGVDAKRDVALSYAGESRSSLLLGDAGSALIHASAYLDAEHALVAIEPANPLFARDEALAEMATGSARFAIGDQRGAMVDLNAAITIARRLSESDPLDATTKLDLFTYLVSRAQFTLDSDKAAARADFNEALLLARRFVTLDGDTARSKFDLAAVLIRLALNFADAKGDADEARRLIAGLSTEGLLTERDKAAVAQFDLLMK